MPVPAVPLCAFVALDPEAWGVAAGGERPWVAAGVLAQSAKVEVVESDRMAADGDWSWQGSGHALRLAAITGTISDGSGGARLCQLSGSVPAGAGPLEVTGGAVASPPLDDARCAEVRLIGAWFPSGHAVALRAARPDGARGQDRDRISVAILGEREGLAVFDPRLSTTYSGAGVPLRASVELWLGESEEADLYPLRVAGEVRGEGLSTAMDGCELRALPLRCHARGEEGVGVYVTLRCS